MLEVLLSICFFLCIFAPFTFVIFLIDAIKKSSPVRGMSISPAWVPG